MREEFEKAMTANVVMPRPHLVPHLHTMFNRLPSGEYAQLWVDAAWIGWQAATALQAEEIERLTQCLAKANGQAEHFEREWYLRGDEIERQAERAREHDLADIRCECCGYMTYHREHMGCIRAAYDRKALSATAREG